MSVFVNDSCMILVKSGVGMHGSLSSLAGGGAAAVVVAAAARGRCDDAAVCGILGRADVACAEARDSRSSSRREASMPNSSSEEVVFADGRAGPGGRKGVVEDLPLLVREVSGGIAS